MMLQKKILFSCGNYIERTDGAIYISMDDSKVFFSHGTIVAISSAKNIYRLSSASQGIIYKRIRAALQKSQTLKPIHNVTQNELNDIFETIIMRTARKLIDHKLGINEPPVLEDSPPSIS